MAKRFAVYSAIRQVAVTLTTADLLQLGAVPVMIVPRPGPGRIALLIDAVALFSPGAVALVDPSSTGPILAWGATDSDHEGSFICSISTFNWGQALTDNVRRLIYLSSPTGNYGLGTDVEDKPITVQNQGSEYTGGDDGLTELTIIVTYRVVETGWR